VSGASTNPTSDAIYTLILPAPGRLFDFAAPTKAGLRVFFEALTVGSVCPRWWTRQLEMLSSSEERVLDPDRLVCGTMVKGNIRAQ